MILQRLYIDRRHEKLWVVLVLATAKGIKRVAHVIMCLCAVCTYVYVEHAVCCRDANSCKADLLDNLIPCLQSLYLSIYMLSLLGCVK